MLTDITSVSIFIFPYFTLICLLFNILSPFITSLHTKSKIIFLFYKKKS